MSSRNTGTLGDQGQDGQADDRITVRRVDKEEPGTPREGPGQEFALFIGHRQIPHEFVVGVGRSEHYRYHRNDHQGGNAVHCRRKTCVLPESDVSGNGQESGTNKMSCPAQRKCERGLGQEFHGTADNPERNDNEQDTDRYGANVAFTRNESQTECHVAGRAKDQQQCEHFIKVHCAEKPVTVMAGILRNSTASECDLIHSFGLFLAIRRPATPRNRYDRRLNCRSARPI